MELPQQADLILWRSLAGVFLCHESIGEVVLLAESETWSLAFDEDGLGVLWNAEGAEVHASECMRYTLVAETADAPPFVLDKGAADDQLPAVTLRAFHSTYQAFTFEVTWVGRPEPVAAPFHVFQHRAGGARVWWAIGLIRKGIFGQTSATWLYGWWDHWHRSLQALGLAVPHLRYAQQTKQTNKVRAAADWDMWRCLPHPCVSTFALVVILARLCKPQTGHFRHDKNGEHIAGWSAFARAWFAKVWAQESVECVVMMDDCVQVRPGLPFGGHDPAPIFARAGRLDLRALAAHPLGSQVLDHVRCVDASHADFLTVLIETSCKQFKWFFKQLVWLFATHCEEALLHFQEHGEKEVELPQDPFAAKRGTVGETWKRFVKRRVDGDRHKRMFGHLYSSRKYFQEAKGANGFLQISAAFDASRVGGLGRMVGVVARGNDLAWPPPQV